MPVSGQARNFRGNLSQDQPAGPFTWNIRLDSSKLTESEVERMREVVRPWLVITKTETVGYTGQAVFTLTARTLGSLATGTISIWHRPVYQGSTNMSTVNMHDISLISQDERNSIRS